MKITRIKKFKKSAWKVAKKIFNKPAYLFICLFCVDLVIAFVLAYQLVFFPAIENKPQSLLVLNKNSLDNFVKNWEEQEKEFSVIESKSYPNIFFGFSIPKTEVATTPIDN